MKRSCLYSTLGKKWRRCGSSTEVMVAFHKNLTDPERAVISKAEALRRAEPGAPRDEALPATLLLGQLCRDQ